MDFQIPWPAYDNAETEALQRVIQRRKWFNGEETRAFEEAYAHFQGARYAAACTSGTTALEIALEALEIGPGDEVIVPPYTFVATASTVLRVGATPVFADIDDTWCLDPAAVEAVVTPRTRAIMPVHFGGAMGNIEALSTIAERHGLVLLEDACHAWGSEWKGQGAGTIGIGGAFSFQESKNLTAGEGGVLVSNDAGFIERCHSIINCGREEGAPWYHHVNLGTNARITEFGAALLQAQLERYPEQLNRRVENALHLDEGLSAIPGITPQPVVSEMTRRSYHLYCFRLDEGAFGMDRNAFLAACEAKGLPLMAGYPLPLYQQPLFQKYLDRHDYNACRCPVTEAVCAREGLWITQTNLLLSTKHMDAIVAGIRDIAGTV